MGRDKARIKGFDLPHFRGGGFRDVGDNKKKNMRYNGTLT